MGNRKRYVAAAISILLCVSLLSACSGSGGTKEPPVAEVLLPESPFSPPPEGAKLADHIEAVFVGNELQNVGVHTPAGSNTVAQCVYRLVFDTLLFFDAKADEFIPRLAKSWDIKDYQEYTFHLRDDVYFHNGEKFTADDVVFTIYACQTWGQGAAALDTWGRVAEYKALDDYTVYMKLKAKDIEFIRRVTGWTCSIVNREAVEADQVQGYMIGSGCYKITSFASMDHITFERFEEYWDEKPLTKTQRWRIIPEANTRSVMLQNGEIDAIFATISEADIQTFKSEPDKFSIIKQSPAYWPICLQFLYTDPICSDYNFRRAVAHAINREEIAMIVQGPDGFVPATDGAMWGYYQPYRRTDIPIPEYNVDLAKEWLAKSKYNGEELVMMAALISVDCVKVAEVLQQQLAEAGIKVKILQTDNAGIQSNCLPEARTNNPVYSMLVWPQLLGGVSTSAYKGAFMSGAMRNRQNFSDAELDQLILLDEVTPYGPEKEQIASRMQEIVSNSLVALNLFWEVSNHACVRELGGIIEWYGNNVPDYRYIYKVVR